MEHRYYDTLKMFKQRNSPDLDALVTIPEPSQGPRIDPDPLRMTAEEPGAGPGVGKLTPSLVPTVDSQQEEQQPASLTQIIVSSPEHFHLLFSVHFSMLRRPLFSISLAALLCNNLNLFIVIEPPHAYTSLDSILSAS